MGFGKKAAPGPVLEQSEVALLASEALAKMRSQRVLLPVRLTFETEVLTHRWSQKVITKMLGSMTGAVEARTPKDLTEDFEQSWYRDINENPCIPTRLIKAAIVEGAVSTGKLVSKAELKRELRIVGRTAPIKVAGKKSVRELLEMDVRVTRNTTGAPDVRARALIPKGAWVDVLLAFPRTMSVDKVVAALAAAGDTIGLCDWRPERGGEFGTFSVQILKGAEHITRIQKESEVPEQEFKIPPHMLRAFNALPAEKVSGTGRKVRSLESVNGKHDHVPNEEA
jgi:hypothetical protein